MAADLQTTSSNAFVVNDKLYALIKKLVSLGFTWQQAITGSVNMSDKSTLIITNNIHVATH